MSETFSRIEVISGVARRLEERVRDLERLLGRKTLELEILKEALELARSKKPIWRSSSALKDDLR